MNRRIFCIVFSFALLAHTAGLRAEELGAKNPMVTVDTSLGTFEIELYESKSPITAKNFIQYVNEKFYDGTIFHRVIDDFMIQGGGFTQDGKEKKTHPPIKNESGNGVQNKKYYVAMARTQDLNSATSQFYINVKDNGFLDEHKYCAFGKVVSGTEVIDKIKGVPTKAGPLTGREKAQPIETIVIKSVRLKGGEDQAGE